MQAQEIFTQLTEHLRHTKMLGSINALLEWDQQTMLPSGGSSYRSEQVKWLAGEIHKSETAPQVGEWLGKLQDWDEAKSPHTDTGATLRELRHQFDKKSKLPLDLVRRQAQLHSHGQQVWIEARQQDDFALFAPVLEEIFQLKREEAQATCSSNCLYDALLDDYEPGASTQEVHSTLQQLRDGLIPLMELIHEGTPTPSHAGLESSHFPTTQQKAFAIAATTAIGFDFKRGRLDIAAHPFCTEAGPDDCRITTRYDEANLRSAFFGCLHEAGHGIYEQGLRSEMYGLPSGRYCSLGIHESQSRLWENLVGRSDGFCRYLHPLAQTYFPGVFDGVTPHDLHAYVNQIKPSLIRVEADEITYNLHIIIRFELEQELLNGELSVVDLPGAWNHKYQTYLGISPPNNRDGVLQDIHWSAGLIGYFPTYALGNIFASMLFQQADHDIGPLQPQFADGEFSGLLNWLAEHVHKAGNRFRSNELMKAITHKTLDHAPLIEHLTQKTQSMYSKS